MASDRFVPFVIVFWCCVAGIWVWLITCQWGTP